MEKLIYITNQENMDKARFYLKKAGIEFEEMYAYDAMCRDEAEIRLDSCSELENLSNEMYKEVLDYLIDDYRRCDYLVDSEVAESLKNERVEEIKEALALKLKDILSRKDNLIKIGTSKTGETVEFIVDDDQPIIVGGVGQGRRIDYMDNKVEVTKDLKAEGSGFLTHLLLKYAGLEMELTIEENGRCNIKC